MTTYHIDNDLRRKNAVQAVLSAPLGYLVQIIKETRSLAQNRKLWACLGDIAEQVCWHGRWLNSEDWKAMLTAGMTSDEPVPGITQGTMVCLGKSTSQMNKEVFRDLIEYIHMFGGQQGVIWSEKSIDVFEEYLMSVGG